MRAYIAFLLAALAFLLVPGLPAHAQNSGAKDCRSVRAGVPVPPIPTGPAASDEIRFAAAGDTGTGCQPGDQDKRLVCQIAESLLKVHETANFGMLVLLGDNVYESGSTDDFPEKLYAPFDRLSQRGVLVRGVVGNHDVRSYEGANLQMKFFQAADAAAQRKYFTTPIREHASFPEGSSRYYSFREDRAGAEFFALDSSMIVNDCCGPTFWKRKYKKEERAAHIDWLLRSLNASRAKWKIVILHHPFYSSALEHGVRIQDGKEKMDERMRLLRQPWPEEGPLKGRSIESVLKEAGVRLVLAGHDHVYERIAPQNGIQHFVSGAAAKLRPDNFDAQLPAFHQCGESRKGSFMLFSIRPDQIEFWSIGQEGEAFDHGFIRE